uniref:Peptidase S9, prolyl oligopeptidase active site domain protein n=1 Tax=Solibacter usitatus (strain Ellin6076) TaxID=234267 RepID=Q01Q22_SOLUE
MRKFIASLGLPVLAMLASAAGKQPITGADVLKIRNVASVAVASDGSFAVYGVQSIHVEPAADSKAEPAYRYRTNLWRIDLNNPNARPEQLTFGDRADSSPAISPDNRTLAFVRTDTPTGVAARPHPQVWLLPLHGPGEAQVITKLENGAAAPVWRPDGKALLVTAQIPISKLEGKPHFDLESPSRDWFDYDRPAPGSKNEIDARPDGDRRALRNWLARNASKDNPTVIDRINFLGEQDLVHEMEIAELYTIDLERDNKATAITRDFYNHSAAQYSPDGRTIVFTSTPAVADHPDRLRRSAVWTMTADGANPHVLLERKDYSFSNPRFTSDGAALVIAGSQTDEPTYRQAHLARFDFKDQKLTWLTDKWDSSARAGKVSADGGVLFATPWQGGEPLLRVSAKGGDVTKLVEGPTGVGAFDEGGGRIVYALISVPDPNELWVREKNGKSRQLTDLNAWVKEKDLVIPEEHWLTRPDGLKVQYWVMNPTHAEAGKRYPWVVEMHGGPSAMWGPGEFSMWWEFQLFCSWGYGVVYANPRGSGGYGYEFQRANFKDWGKSPMNDVLAALEDTEQHNSMVDKDRLFLTGGSYAGYLTAWMIGHDQRFKAASAQRGVYDLSTFYGEANAWSLVPEEFGGYPWEPEIRKLLDEESPITYVNNIRTPFLIIHGSQDFRTGFAQSEMLFRSLKQLNRPVEYVRYPAIGHELTRSGPPLQRMDHMLRIIEFFERYAKNDRPAPTEQKESAATPTATAGARR